MKANTEKRLFDFEIRAEESTDGKLVGRAVPFDSETVIGGVFREVFRPGSLTKTLRESKNIAMLWQHRDEYPMGSTRSGTLRLREAADGLHFELDPPKEAPFSGFVDAIRRGDVAQMSFGFIAVKENRVVQKDELDLREITEARLIEISPVTFPAYEDTEVQARAAEVAARWASEELDEAAEMRTTPEPGTSVAHSVEPDGFIPSYVLNRCELDAAEEELLSYEIARTAASRG